MSTRPRIAFVVQRCGTGVNGGAELLCLLIAQRMAPFWDVEILTTCALDYVSWANHFPAGEDTSDNILIRRFPVDVERNSTKFNDISSRLLPRQRLCTLKEQQEWMQAQGPVCSRLTSYIHEQRDAYAAFLFFGYLYATTFDNLPMVADKAWLIPCTHDEWPLNFSMFDRLFSLPRGFFFNTAAEREFTIQRFFHLKINGPVAGIGIEAPLAVDPASFRARLNYDGPFLLYCGRIDASKGCEDMLTAFLEWKETVAQPHKLVLIGKSVIPIPDHPDIIPLGFVSEEVKWNAMAACQWLIMPSRYESLSIVLLEAWATGRPALVNGQCRVLVEHCQRSAGGFAFDSWDEAFAIVEVCALEDTNQLGTNGRAYVDANYKWPDAIAKYRAALASIQQTSAQPARSIVESPPFG